jgi:hypothetical protein
MYSLNIDKKIAFKGDANNNANIAGNPSYEKVVVYDDFTGADISAYWTQSDDNGGTVAIGATGAATGAGSTAGGSVTITTGGTDDDRGIITGSLNFFATKNAVVEARVMVDRITACSFGVGFTDATTEGNDLQPFSVSGSTVTDTADNGAAIVFDTDATTDYFWVVNSKATTGGGNILGSTYVPVADTYINLRVELDTTGAATYYINGVAVGHKAAAVTATTPLCPYVSAINRAGGALICTIDYIKVWQDR